MTQSVVTSKDLGYIRSCPGNILLLILCTFYCRDMVIMLLAITDPTGAQERRKHKLQRRGYHNKVNIDTIIVIALIVWICLGP